MSEEMNYAEQTFNEGDIVKGIAAQVDEKAVSVSIPGAPFDGIVPISELSSLHIEKASDVISVGDELELMITKVEEENFVLSKRKVDALKAWDTLEQQFAAEEIFEAEVKDIVKGGLVVDLGVRGFVPASLVEDYFVDDFEGYKGKTLSFKIVELDKDKNRLILSHRAVVEAEKASQKKNVINQIKAGEVLDGKVQRLASFGAFIDLGGIDGLVHISQVSHEHVNDVSEVLAEGQDVKVKVLSVDPENERISLSIKETMPGPWSSIEERAAKGTILDGRVKRLTSFGAFVEVFPGVEGLVHISQIAHKHINTPHEALKEGQEVQVKVLDVNAEEGRLALSIKELLENPEAEEVIDYELPEENTGFSFGDVIGDQLKNFK
ncbi:MULTISPECIES: 30S ribosomal protein S1 [Lysinibacillus]|jgi:small subunit ribosomal protein S1|uniref:30S ribosomal protein S1 n=1 Tax=Lysinibacillus fusiformis TaxID=28031 RepID=A0A2I0V3P6_9BACI|nr:MULTISPECIES: 30S ribosomal protein S1 [Lysinibacillus]KUF33145.1 30S ribosomal protein S1 [Lysinibacillus sp. F5]PKU52908.1 30S ribosomal protein S1 [Lysinibacillus fusiformis]SCY63416.1 small subunit ribosomal protein S1 [Lysinibacillus sp. SG9]SDB25637.1 small subunit ribosomal protein S1 [Lysinibacillus sp. TC-37]SFS83777.1 small subunit ribosomal protein S1 [Lysinibacillus sp. SG55]